MAADPPADFLTRSEAARIYNRSQRALERDLDTALRAGDPDVLSHWVLFTKDGEVRAADQVTINLVKQLQIDGKIPVWYVQESHLEEQYGRKGMPKPPRTVARPTADAQQDTTEAETSTTDEKPTTEKADLSPNDIEFLKERIRTLEQEKREEAKRNEQREAKLFEQLAVKDKQISNWDEITQGLMRGLATGQLRPDAGTMVLVKPDAEEKREVADTIVEDAVVVNQETKAKNTRQKDAPSVAGTTNKGKRRKRKKSTTQKDPATPRQEETGAAPAAKPKWYETPTIRRYLPRKK